MNRSFRPVALALLVAVSVASGCRGNDEDSQQFVRKTPVTVADATREPLQAVETTVGRLEATSMPALAAETSGRVVRLHVEIGRASCRERV